MNWISAWYIGGNGSQFIFTGSGEIVETVSETVIEATEFARDVIDSLIDKEIIDTETDEDATQAATVIEVVDDDC